MPKVLVARLALAFVSALAWAGCTVHNTEAPPVSGPSEFGLSFNVTATPDSISQDGGTQSTIVVRAFDANGAPKSGVSFRLDIAVGNTPVDYGTLSFKNLVTGADGRATSMYTAPPALPAGANLPSCNALPGTCVTISATAVGTDFGGARSQVAYIHLIPQGVILPPSATPTASFVFNPSTPSAKSPVQFDASGSCAGPATSTGGCSSGAPVDYLWEFSDGGTASGRLATHSFALAQTYSVTLTVTNDRGIKASTTKSVPVGSGSAPTAAFVFSPTPVLIGAFVFFDASNSRPGLGHTIATYTWNWGDGEMSPPRTSPFEDHDYMAAGVYTVVLTVTDDGGQVGTASQSVTVGGANPVASFSSAVENSVVHRMAFDGTQSTATGAATIVTYSWDFGDGSAAVVTPTVSHSFPATGTYLVKLTVTDSNGKTGVVSKSVAVP